MELYDVIYVLMMVLMVGISASMFYKWITNLHMIKSINAIPGLQVNIIASYLMLFKNIYLVRHMKAANVILLQIICGLCKIFDKERIAHIWVGSRPFVFFFKPETVEMVLSKYSTIEKSKEYDLLQPWLGNGIFVSSGEKWRARRKLLAPTFHLRILENFIPIYNEQSQVLIHKLKRLANDDWVDIVPIITLCALDIICETAMGVQVNAQTIGESEYVKAIHEVGKAFIFRALRPWLWFDIIYYMTPSGRQFWKNINVVHKFTRKVVKEKKELLLSQQKEKLLQKDSEHEEQNGVSRRSRKAFLELILEHHINNNILSEEDVKDEVDNFMFAGHDTTAMSMCWSLYNIGLYPHVQEKIQMELESIFGDSDRLVNSEDLNAMKYLDCVLKESLRLYPTIPFITRELKEDMEVLNYTVPSGAVCFIFPYVLHRDPEVYPNPEVFDPERFLPEIRAKRHSYAYIPFSAGPRNCFGKKYVSMEEKILISSILRNFTVKSLDEKDRVNVVAEIILRNVETLRIKLIPRHK